ncbi:GNAT family N-acetyltransferase [Streptomyces sp. NPDC092903]|uniref:GNAT family N-acetyltransferase n=1 Tax=Streptomyces sp. NPDC092903 TaxID=3366017 RepID=UPI0037F90AD5
MREATTEDADVLADVHTRTRTAYYTAGGMPEEEFAGPSAWGERRDAWARVLGAPARVTVVAEDLDGTAVGLLTAGPPHYEDLDASTYYELYQIGVLAHAWGGGVGGALYREFVALASGRLCRGRAGVLGIQHPCAAFLRPERVAAGWSAPSRTAGP